MKNTPNQKLRLVGVSLVLALMAPSVDAHNPLKSGDRGMTNSPLDKNTCSSCHNATSTVNQTPNASLTGITGTTYSPGTIYALTLSVTTSSSGKNGFEITSENATAKAGSFSVGSATDVQLISNSNWLGHRSAKTGNATWSFNWTAPAAGSGKVCFYLDIMAQSSGQRGPEWFNSYCYNEAAGTAPVITTQPTNQTAFVGQTVTVSVVATGGGLTYQWQGAPPGSTVFTNILGGTSPSYSSPPLSLSDSGQQSRCVITNSAGSVTSNVVTVTVNVQPPSITTQPGNQSVLVGQTATFNVSASGTSPLSYQWQSAPSGSAVFANVSGATAASYTTPITVLTDSGAKYRCVVTNTANSATSNAATLTVSASATPPSITVAPQSQSVIAGQTVTFSVSAAGTAPLGYQWKKAPSGSSTFTNISGATSAAYTTPATTLSDNGSQFECVVTNTAGSVTSSAATLTIGAAPPTIVNQPADLTVSAGKSATFSVTVSGTSPFTYQWKSAPAGSSTFSAINGATASSYTIPTISQANNGALYQCVITNAAGSVTSLAATLSVIAPVAPDITLQPADVSVGIGQSATFSVTVADPADPTLTYTWYRDGVIIPAASNGKSTYTLLAVTAADQGAQFYCICENAGGPNISDSAQLLVTQAVMPPQISNLKPTMSLGDTLQVGTPYSLPVTFYWTFTKTGSVKGFASLRNAALSNVTTASAKTTSYSSALPVSSLGIGPGQYQISLIAADSSGNLSPATLANVVFLTDNLGGVRVYPNPWRVDRNVNRTVTFDRLTANSTVKIFTVSGHFVKSLIAASGSVAWDLTTDSGDRAAYGIYLYLITDDSGQKARGQLIIID